MSCLLVFVAYTLHTGFKNVTNPENFTSHTIAIQVVSVKRFVSNSKLSSFGNFKYVEQLIFARQQHTAAFKLKQQWFGSKYVWNSIVLCHLVLVFTLRGGQFAFFQSIGELVPVYYSNNHDNKTSHFRVRIFSQLSYAHVGATFPCLKTSIPVQCFVAYRPLHYLASTEGRRSLNFPYAQE